MAYVALLPSQHLLTDSMLLLLQEACAADKNHSISQQLQVPVPSAQYMSSSLCCSRHSAADAVPRLCLLILVEQQLLHHHAKNGCPGCDVERFFNRLLMYHYTISGHQ